MTMLPDAICTKCCKPATMMCQRCQETYCSADCQILDWKEHKSKCYQMPNLVPIRKSQPRMNGTPNTTFNESYQSQPVGGQTHMRQPHNRNYDVNRRNRNDSGSEVGGPRSMARNHQTNSTRDATDTKPVALLEDKDFTLKPKAALKQEHVAVVTDCSKGAIPKRPPTPEAAPWMSPFLPPEGKYFEAVVQWLQDEQNPNVIWVTECKYDEPLNKLLIEINRSINKSTPCPVEEIQVGSLLSAPLDNIYYRAEVLQINKSDRLATVRLIDYGNQLQVPYAELRSCIPIMRNLNAYAIRVQLPKDCPQDKIKIEAILSIRVLNVKAELGIFFVDLKPATIPLELSLEMLACKPEMLLRKVFTGGQHALLQYASFKDFTADMNEQLRTELSSDLDFVAKETPAEGSFVAANTSQGWRRASFLGHCEEIKSNLVYLIDEGRVGMCKQLKKIPDNFITLPMRNIAITVASSQTLLNESMLIKAGKLTLCILGSVTPPRKKLQSLPCALFAKEEKITDVVVSTFVGNLDALGVKCWMEDIVDGSLVYITHVLTQAEVCISSTSSKEYPELFTTLARKCTPFGAKDEIVQNDIVLAALAGKNSFFRAKILSKIPNDAFKVLDIDTGRFCEVSRDLFRKPNLFVRSCPVYMKRVKLIYVDKIPTPIEDNKAVATLMQCRDNNVEFIVRHDVNDNEIVDLLMKTDDQQSLSKQLLPLLFEKNTAAVPVCPTMLSDYSSVISADETPLPPSPPDTPIIKVAPVQFSTPSQPTKIAAALESSTVSIANLNIQDIKAKAAAKIYTLDDLEIIDIPNGDNVPLTVLDASTIGKGYITACDSSNKESLKLMDVNLNEVKKHGKCPHSQKNYEPKLNEICLTLFKDDGDWYRALCVNVLKDGKFHIMFLDYGNMCVVSKDEILPITKDLMFPSNANLCCIEDFPQNLTKQQLLSFLDKTLSNPIINCKVTKQDDDTYLIKIHDMEKYFA